MAFSLLATKRFRKQLDELDELTKNRVKEALKGLTEDPFTSRSNVDIKQLKNTNPTKYRLRVGNYRIFYFIVNEEIKLLKIADRKNAYKR